MKNKILAILYWTWSITWNCLLTIPGLFATLFIVIFLKGKVHKNGFSIITEIGGNWGGLSLGAFAFCGGYTTVCENKEWFEHTRKHEFGHSIQGLWWGPLFAFVIGIPSVIRYHWYNHRALKGLPVPDYDAVWFEGHATKIGYKAINNIEGGKK